MKRLILSAIGLATLSTAAGCCCDWCRPCGTGCNPYGAGFQGPPAGGAYLTPYAAPAVGAIAYPMTTSAIPPTYSGPAATAYLAPLESLPTY